MNNTRKHIKNNVKQNKLVQTIVNWYKTATLPGFEGVPIQYVVSRFIEEIRKDKIGPRASAVSYSFLLALFPTLIFIFSLIPIIPITGLQETIFELVQQILPNDAFLLFRSTIEDTISQRRVDLLSFGFFAMIIFASNGVSGILKSFTKENEAYKKRGFFREWFVAFSLVIMLSLLMVSSLVLIIGGSTIVNKLVNYLDASNGQLVWTLSTLRWLIIMGNYFLSFSIIYYFAPALKYKWRFISVGGTFATVLSVLASVGFSYYVNNFAQYNQLYGSLGTFIVIMSWIFINSLVLLFGFELNNSIRLNKMEYEDQDDEELISPH